VKIDAQHIGCAQFVTVLVWTLFIGASNAMWSEWSKLFYYS